MASRVRMELVLVLGRGFGFGFGCLVIDGLFSRPMTSQGQSTLVRSSDAKGQLRCKRRIFERAGKNTDLEPLRLMNQNFVQVLGKLVSCRTPEWSMSISRESFLAQFSGIYLAYTSPGMMNLASTCSTASATKFTINA